MRTVIGVVIFALVLFMTLASATDYYVDIHEGIGAGTGDDKPQNTTVLPGEEDEEDDEEEGGDDNGGDGGSNKKKRKIHSSILFGDKAIIIIDEFAVVSNSLFLMNENADVSNTAKVPIDWGPIVVWGIIFAVVGFIGFIGWNIYQIYFY